MSAVLKEKGKVIDNKSVDFGMREFRTNGTRFEVNGQPGFPPGNDRMLYFPANRISSCRYGIMGENSSDVQGLWSESYAVSFILSS